MATTPSAEKSTATKPVTVKKPPIAMFVRITAAMKRAALQGKLSAAELDNLANLANALKTFISAS